MCVSVSVIGFLQVWLHWISCKMVCLRPAVFLIVVFFPLPDENVKAGVHQGHRCTLGSAHT